MKLLYGVQGTGNGHITRARALSRYLPEFGVEVDYLFSGRSPDAYFDMDVFQPNVRFYQGLSFSHHAGKVKYLSTLRDNDIRQFWNDARELDLTPYDAVITDFEPVTAWAARLNKVPAIGIGHQYAFQYDVPMSGDNMVAKSIMRYFAPTNHAVGLHWHHFNCPILPPIAEVHKDSEAVDDNKILVYFGFEDPEDVIEFLSPFKSHVFVIYGPFERFQSFDNIQLKPLSRTGFCHDLATSVGVISNAGFELSSEAIQLGKKLLVKPLEGQMEQHSNARALEELGLGMSMPHLDPHTLSHWLENFEGQRVIYPNVAKEIALWLSKGDWEDVATLSSRLWEETQMISNAEGFDKSSEIAA